VTVDPAAGGRATTNPVARATATSSAAPATATTPAVSSAPAARATSAAPAISAPTVVFFTSTLSTASRAAATSPEAALEQLLRSMTLAEKVGQRIATWIEATELTRELVTETHVAGVILTAANISDSEQIRTLTDDLQSLASANEHPIGLFIAVDQEGERVARLRLPEVTRLPAAANWGALYDADYAEALAYVLGRELRYHGANLNLAMVLDLASGIPTSIIGDRAFSPDPDTVAELGAAYVQGATRAGLLVHRQTFPPPRCDHDRLTPGAAAGIAESHAVRTESAAVSRSDRCWPTAGHVHAHLVSADRSRVSSYLFIHHHARYSAR